MAALLGQLRVVRHLLRQNPALLNQEDPDPDGPGPRRAVAVATAAVELRRPSRGDGWTALMHAADVYETNRSWPNAAVVDFLLQRNADFAAADSDGRRPQSRPTSATALQSATLRGRTALHQAAIRGNAEVVKRLITAGAPLNVKDRYGPEPQRINDRGEEEREK